MRAGILPSGSPGPLRRVPNVLGRHHVALDREDPRAERLAQPGRLAPHASVPHHPDGRTAQFPRREPLPFVARPFVRGLGADEARQAVPEREQHHHHIFRHLGRRGARKRGELNPALEDRRVRKMIQAGHVELDPHQVRRLVRRRDDPQRVEHLRPGQELGRNFLKLVGRVDVHFQARGNRLQPGDDFRRQGFCDQDENGLFHANWFLFRKCSKCNRINFFLLLQSLVSASIKPSTSGAKAPAS